MKNRKIHNNLKTMKWTRQSAPNNNSYRSFIFTVLFTILHLFYLLLYDWSHKGNNCVYIGNGLQNVIAYHDQRNSIRFQFFSRHIENNVQITNLSFQLATIEIKPW